MLDFATRVHNHNYRLDPIVRSLLDTDFYKFLMHQFIWMLYPGMVIGNGEKYRHLKEEPRSQWDEDQSQRVSYNLKVVADWVRPQCILPSIALRYDISISRDTIWTKTAMLVNESTILQISAASICFNIIRMFISKPCPHPNESGLRLDTYSKDHGLWAEGLCLNPHDVNKLWSWTNTPCQNQFILQQVGRNTLGQWISCTADVQGIRDMVLVWQHYSCLECIIKNLPRSRPEANSEAFAT